MTDDFDLPDPSCIHLNGGTVKAFAADLLKSEVVLKIAFGLREDLLDLSEPMSALASAKKIVDVTLRTRDRPSNERQMSLSEALTATPPGGPAMIARNAILAETAELPPLPADLFYQFVVAGNGLFCRAADTRLEALVPVVHAAIHGLADVQPYATLKVSKIPAAFLESILQSARAHLPNEAMYQLLWDPDRGDWKIVMPESQASETGVTYQDNPLAAVDVHSHGALGAFFSETDNRDEQGLRFYAVLGNLDDTVPDLMVRVGVYGWRMDVLASTLFEPQELVIDLNEIAAANAEEVAAQDAAETPQSVEGDGTGTALPALDETGEERTAEGETEAPEAETEPENAPA